MFILFVYINFQTNSLQISVRIQISIFTEANFRHQIVQKNDKIQIFHFPNENIK